MKNEIKNKENFYITNYVLKDRLLSDFVPLSLTASLIAPFTRMKLILQTNKFIAIEESQKVNKIRELFLSK
jgi:hypothetical protein